MTTRTAAREGFTLIEMLVVLAILGALSLVALRAAGGLQDRARFDATQLALKSAEEAIVGSPASTVPPSFASGFLADMGRLPNPAAAAGAPLWELWNLPAGASASHIAIDPVDTGVHAAVGWRGPYLRLAPGAANPLDGYGNPLDVIAQAAPTVTWRIRSLGADGAVGGASYDADLEVVLADSSTGVQKTIAEITGSVSVSTAPPGVASWSAVVFAYSPDPATGELLAKPENADVESPDLTSTPVVFHFQFSGANALTPGPRVLRAYVFETGTLPRENALQRSAVTSILLKPGAQTIDLTVNP